MSIHVDTVTSLDALLTATRDGLLACAGLAGVNIFSGPVVDDKALGLEYILLAGATDQNPSVSATYEYRVGTPMQLADESYDVPCELLGTAPATADNETGAVAARQRAFAILAEIHGWFKDNDTAAGTVQDARISGYKATQMLAEDGRQRVCKIEFTVSVLAKFITA